MISSAEKTMTVLGISFRLLNSEIGNDQKSMEMIKKAFRGFRLLNSEIGNDRNCLRIKVKLKTEFSSP